MDACLRTGGRNAGIVKTLKGTQSRATKNFSAHSQRQRSAAQGFFGAGNSALRPSWLGSKKSVLGRHSHGIPRYLRQIPPQRDNVTPTSGQCCNSPLLHSWLSHRVFEVGHVMG